MRPARRADDGRALGGAAGGRDAAPRPHRDHQDLSVGRCERERRSHRDARRDPRGAGRERRRQEHADEDDLRRRQAGRRRDALGGSAGRRFEPGARARARHQHGVPALLALRDAVRRRERRACAARPRRPDGAIPPDHHGVGEVRPAGRPAPDRAFAVGRRAAAGRDHALPAADAEAPHHGRADVGADAAGGAQAVRNACASSRPKAARSSTSATSSTRSRSSATRRPSCAAAR